MVKIGNSKGLRLSKDVLERYKIGEKVELVFRKGYIIIKPKKQARQGWEKAFKQMHQCGDDKLLLGDVFEDETFEEWK